MIKNIFLTLMMQENGIKNIFKLKRIIFIILFGITNVIFPIIFNSFLYFTVQKYSFSEYLGIAFLEIKDNFIFSVLLLCILLFLFYIHTQKKYLDLVFKAVIAMNFIHPVMTVINYYIGNIFFEIVFIIYDIFFIKTFIKNNLQDEKISHSKQFLCIISAFIIMLFIYGFIYKILLLN